MTRVIGLVAALSIGVLLAGCSNTAQIGKMSVKGGAFEKGLHKNYIKLANAEHEEDDWADGWRFEDRAKMAAMGKPTSPEMLSARSIPKKHRKPLASAYNRLTAAFRAGGAKKAGKQAANAQTSFECWMQEAEENIQPKHIGACRNKFYGAMALLEGAAYAAPRMASKPMEAKTSGPPRTKNFLVFFDLDSAKIGGGEGKSLNAAAKFFKATKGASIYVTGHADRSGSKKYNMKIAEERAGAVAKALTGMGIKKRQLGSFVQGENDPAVPTRDGVKEPRNRRVVISVIY